MSKTIDDFFDKIDSARIFRVKELSEIERLFGPSSTVSDPLGVQSKALVVLSYAAWEGFYNECVDTYCDFLQTQGKKVSDVEWKMLVGVLDSSFDSLQSRSLQGKESSEHARRKFVENLQERLECDFQSFNRETIKSRSNLNLKRLRLSFGLLGFDLQPFIRHGDRLNEEIVKWRHGVAHGNAPDNLGALNVAGHISLVGEIMMLVADTFQTAMLRNLQ